MGIFIQNMGPTDDNVNCDPQGEHNYQVKINNKLICFFKHKRHKGLTECLEKAAKAVKETPNMSLINYFLDKEKK